MKDVLLFDVSFDKEILKPDNQNIVKTKIKEKIPDEPLVKTENEESENRSSSDENQIHVESTGTATIVLIVSSKEPSALKNITFNPKFQVLPISLRASVGPNPPRPSRNPVLQERPYQASDVQQTSQTVKGKTKLPSKLNMAKQSIEIGLPSSSDKRIQRWEDYRDIQDVKHGMGPATCCSRK